VNRADEILAFWFGTPDDPTFEAGREVWFKPSRTFDEQIRARFLADYEAARRGIYDGWMGAAETCLALIVALDQFPRNLFRNSPRSYECDERALSVARHAVAHGLDRRLRPLERSFAYLPYEHSEDLAAQQEGVALFHGLATHAKGAEWLDYAVRHMRIVERFGRFPHRNAILGRASTPEEVEFLKGPNSSFLRVPTE
jgi:uncharacterized protein (DUF924 family)